MLVCPGNRSGKNPSVALNHHLTSIYLPLYLIGVNIPQPECHCMRVLIIAVFTEPRSVLSMW